MKTMRKENMKFLTWLLLLIFTLGVVSCSKEDAPSAQEEIGENKLATITITAYAGENDDDTKTVIAGENDEKVHWNPNEKINIFYNGTSHLFTSTNTVVDKKSSFTGTITGITNPAQLAGEQIFGLYPYDFEAKITSDNRIVTNLPSVQTAMEDTFADNLNISVGKSTTDGTTMKFFNVCSGLCFTVTHNDIKTVVLRGANEEVLAGRIRIQFTTVDGKEVPIVQSIVAPDKTGIITVEAPNGGTFIPGKKYYILTIPQSLPDGLIIEGFRADGKVYTCTINKSVTLKRSVFARKKNFDAELTPEDLYDYTLTVTPLDAYAYTGGNKSFTVTSHRTLKSDPSKKIPIAWKSQISTDNGTTWNDLTKNNKSSYGADWFSFSPSTYSGTGNIISNYVVVDMAERGAVDLEAIHTMTLKSGKHPSGIDNSTKANAIDLSMYNLSGNSISQTTANCYIVNAPGWYKFPMVYGNAIKNGTTNTNAFVSSATQVANNNGEDAVLMNFVDHNGANITQPWVSSTHSGGAYSISKAELVWQDEPNLVTDITIGNSGSNIDYIYFYVDQNTIHQGNAVIAAYTGSTVAWSWHIWITDEDLSTPVATTNKTNITYNFLPVNLGWSDMGVDPNGYLPRYANIRIYQPCSGIAIDCPVIQNGFSDSHYEGNSPFYHWGRKDPLLPSDGTGAYNYKTWYDKDGTSYDSRPERKDVMEGDGLKGKDLISNMIQNPFNYYFLWVNKDYQYYNLWSSNENGTGFNDNIVVKTVYDPSPIGYSLPASNAWTGFITTEEYSTDLSTLNVSGNFHYGWNFYTNSSKSATTFYQCAGWVGPILGLYDPQESGNYWSAHAETAGYAYHLELENDGLAVHGHGMAVHGFLVRSCQEK